MKKLLIAGLSAALVVGFSACSNQSTSSGGSSGGGRVALVAKANSAEYWVKVKEGAEAAGKELGVDVSFNGPDTESEGDKQLNQLQSAINDKPLGIGFAPQDGAQDGAPALMDRAKESGVPVVIFDTPLNGSDVPVATVASDNKGMGAQAAEKLVALTGGKGVDVAFEALGVPATWTTALDVLADGGRMVPIGLGAGVQTAEVEINRTVRRSQSILGSYGARTRQDLPAVVDLAARGVINYKDVVSRRFPLSEAGAGYEALRNHRIQGRAVVDMSL